jgi:hypothetical protein
MPWLSSGSGSASRSRPGGRDAHRTLRQKTELIRKAMLECLDGDTPPVAAGMARKIYLATDAGRLWHLRGELMTALALSQGEALARAKVASLDPLFRDVLPDGPAAQLFGALAHPLQRGEST